MSKSKALVIYTGGTIGMIKDAASGALMPVNIDLLLQYIPELSRIDAEISIETFEQTIDSSDITPQHWIKLVEIIERNYDLFDGFVILHGSDTMAYTASALSFMLENLSKPVILTGAQLPIGVLRSDAKENFITALELALLKENGRAKINEICIYFEYHLLRGNRTTKFSASHFNAFLNNSKLVVY
jgi:L-asparaginase